MVDLIAELWAHAAVDALQSVLPMGFEVNRREINAVEIRQCVEAAAQAADLLTEEYKRRFPHQ